MDELQELRQQIDDIDREILACFERRIACVQKVAAYKIRQGIPVLDSTREAELMQKRYAMLRDKTLKPDVQQLFQLLLHISRAHQQDMMQGAQHTQQAACGVAFQGEPGANSEAALRGYFGVQVDAVGFPAFEDVFEAVSTGAVQYGVVPIENSSTGGLPLIYDLLNRYGLSIVGEQPLAIEHVLLGVPGAVLGDVTDIYSHEQALLQCSTYLKQLHVELHPYHNTAASAKYIAEQGDRSKAAIASGYAGKLYNLQPLAHSISNQMENTTRFLVVGAHANTDGDADKASVCFVLPHRVGALAQALALFVEHGLNMVKIESRPLPGRVFQYIFYVDFEGERIREGMAAIPERTDLFLEYRVLGCYKKRGI